MYVEILLNIVFIGVGDRNVFLSEHDTETVDALGFGHVYYIGTVCT